MLSVLLCVRTGIMDTGVDFVQRESSQRYVKLKVKKIGQRACETDTKSRDRGVRTHKRTPRCTGPFGRENAAALVNSLVANSLYRTHTVAAQSPFSMEFYSSRTVLKKNAHFN